MMNATWITLAVVAIVGVTKFLTYLWGDKRRIRILQDKLAQKEKEYAQALAKNDTIRMSLLDIELRELRGTLGSIAH